tara:strand:- start:803 stop:1546 length:744 start_codon:yes stop_codon:yes gene_type:complete
MKKTIAKKKVFILLIIFILLIFTSCAEKREIIMVAASLKDVINSEYSEFGSKHIFINYGGSLSLARRININEKKIGGVIFASQDSIDILTVEGVIDADSLRTFASNSLVIVTSSNTKYSLNDIHNTNKRLLIADPEIAPAGVYSFQAIEKIFSKNFIEKNIILSGDVSYVSNILKNNKDLFGIVYNTEAIKNDLKIIYKIPLEYHDKIEYKMGVLKNNDNHIINDFLDTLESDTIKNKLSELGFLIN